MRLLLLVFAVLAATHDPLRVAVTQHGRTGILLPMRELTQITAGQVYYCTDLQPESNGCGVCHSIDPGWWVRCSVPSVDVNKCTPGSSTACAPSPVCTLEMKECGGEVLHYDNSNDCAEGINQREPYGHLCNLRHDEGTVAHIGPHCSGSCMP